MDKLAHDRLLSVREAAAALGVTPKTIHRRVWDGQLPAVKLGGAPNSPLRIAASDLAAWLEQVNR